jgi:MscS family membrane protein
MLDNLLPFDEMNTGTLIFISLLITALGTGLLYVILFNVLRSLFRKFERDIALVTLNVSAYPALIVFSLLSLKISLGNLVKINIPSGIEHLLTAGLIIALSYWFVQLFTQVFIYYLKDYTQQTEVMWDDVLLPLLEAVVPIIIFTLGGVFVLKSFGVDLTGIWVTLGGATFVLGFAAQDILANFFSGVVLLIDSPFQFGDVLRLENGSTGILRKIGVRVTKLYMFSEHCDVYIPNSVLQGQNLTNLSRPTSYYYHSQSIEIPSEWDLAEVKKLMEEIVLAHPDTLGEIETKLEMFEQYYDSMEQDPNLIKQQKIAKSRLLAEQEVNLKLEEIDQALESLVVTLQFAEKGGLTPEEIENIQEEYKALLELMGFQVIAETNNSRTVFNFQENKDKEALIELIRNWYRIAIKDPNLLDEDQYFISEEWEQKINLLKKRAQRLYQKISNHQSEETRLDDYVIELIKWLKERFKEPRRKWQEPKIRMKGINHCDSSIYAEFQIEFFVDDIKLENGKRGDRVSSQIYEAIISHLKTTYVNWNRPSEEEEAA